MGIGLLSPSALRDYADELLDALLTLESGMLAEGRQRLGTGHRPAGSVVPDGAGASAGISYGDEAGCWLPLLTVELPLLLLTVVGAVPPRLLGPVVELVLGTCRVDGALTVVPLPRKTAKNRISTTATRISTPMMIGAVYG